MAEFAKTRAEIIESVCAGSASGIAIVRRDADGGGVIAGKPWALARICEMLGFKNSCSKGRVFLTAPKFAKVEAALARAASVAS